MAGPHLSLLLAAGLALLLAACAPRADVATASPPQAPAATTPALPGTTPAVPDASCKVASDCAVRNVGNCCGYYPACVNANAAVDAQAVRAQCERDGMASVCGWQEIEACDCVQNRCQAAGAALPVDR